MKKICILLVLLFSCSLLHSQVNFQYEFSFDKLNPTDNLLKVRLFDYDDDGIEEIAAHYWDYIWENWQMVIYDQNGDTLKTINIDDWTFESYNKFCLFKSTGNNFFFRARIADELYFVTMYIQDCETLNIIDSLRIFRNRFDVFWDVKSINQLEINDDIFFLIGVLEGSFCDHDVGITYLYKMKYENDTLSYIEKLENCGLSNTIFDGDILLTTGVYQSSYVGAWPSAYYRYYLNTVTKEIISTVEQLHSVNGTVVWEDSTVWYHYPKNYKIITSNSQSNYPQILQYKIYDTEEGNSVHFKAYDTNTWQQSWSKDDTMIGKGYINSSTCIPVNGEDHYVMYFRGDKLEIRDRITGNIIHHQDSVLAISYIKRKNDGELLFFVENQDETGYDVYILDGEIFVSADEPCLQSITSLHNSPNPFTQTTTISFNLAIPIIGKQTRINIYNIKGQLVKTLIPIPINRDDQCPMTTIEWYGKDESGKPVSSGIYFYILEVGDKVIDTKKCLLLK